MKIYLRLLQYCRPIARHAIPYSFFTLFAIIFGVLNFTLIIPLLNVLFGNISPAELQAMQIKPEFSYNLPEFILKSFNYYYAFIIDHYGKYEALQFVCVIVVLSVLFGNFFRYFSQRVMETWKVQTVCNLRSAIFSKITSLHLGYFSNERKGDILSKITGDVGNVEGAITSTLGVFFKEPVTLIMYFVSLFIISAKLTLFTILVIPISGLIISYFMKKLKREARETSESYGRLMSIVDETLSGLRVIKAFNAKEYTDAKFNAENNNLNRLTRKMALRKELASPFSEFTGVLISSFILLYGGHLVLSQNSELSAGTFIGYIILFSQVLRPAKAISGSLAGVQTGLASGERILNLIDTGIEVYDVPGAKTFNKFEKSIEFKNVSFNYKADKPILKNINFRLQRGKMLALVGPSGGGKSTLADLITRFYDPAKGVISIDGTDIREYKVDSLRALMGVVTQESILFNDSIFNNIAFGKPNATEEEVIKAAKVANAHQFILNCENGYYTNIGDRGMKLSGGQKQRLSIARAVLKNPPILILDEATSALDTESEKLVQEALDNLMENRTSLVIAHRLSTIQKADHILVIQNGEIIEEGNHETLLEIHKGVYKRLNTMQTL
jgi:ATP-binding cassette, subfamily B, bacterial MsbA